MISSRNIRLLTFIIISTLFGNLQAQNSAEIYVVSALDLTDSLCISKLTVLPKGSKKDTSILISFGIGIESKKDHEILIKNVKALKKAYDKVYLIPGEREWTNLKAKGIKKLDDLFQDTFNQDILIPDNACGELETKDINDKVTIAAIDSKWYLQNWDEDNYINKKCEIRDRALFWSHFSDELSSLKDRLVLLFTYHPPLRYDKSSGYYPLQNHFLPIPVLGTLITMAKSHSRGTEYATHPVYRDYASRIQSSLNFEPNVISISGEAAYQMDHLNADKGHYINLNSAAADDYIAKKRVDWHSDKPAYMTVAYQDGKYVTQWFDLENRKFLFERKVDLDPEIVDTVLKVHYSLDKISKDSYTSSILEEGDIPSLNGFFFGKLNTSFYYDQVEAPVLNLNNHKGGLSTVKIGGGRQTRSVRVVDNNDIEYAIRSIEKTPEKLVPPPFDISPIKSLVSYYFTATHPYGFLVSSALETKLDIYRTDPKLMYLPTQQKLKPYNDEVGDRLVLFRERADGDRRSFKEMGNSKEVISTSDFFEEVRDNDAQADAYSFLKARLLDILMNDWDRHEDQWRWAKDKDKGDPVDTYYAIPRDRDQAFSNYNGFFIWALRQYIPVVFQLRPFDDKIGKGDVKWNHYLASDLDKNFLTSLSKNEWDSVTDTIVNAFSNEVIDSIFNKLPEGIKNDKLDQIKSNFKKRIENLETTSNQFYEIINKNALVSGSSREDSVVVTFAENEVEVTLYAPNDDDKYFTKFSKSFSDQYTNEIWIYTYSDDDKIIVKGEPKSSIKLRLIGGYDDDTYDIANPVKRKCVIYDLNDDNNIPASVKKKVTEDKEVINLNRTDFMLDYSWFIPSFAFNTDDGLYLGGNYQHHTYGFKTHWTHDFSLAYAGKRSSTLFEYKTIRNSKLTSVDQLFRAAYYGPRYELNYFGTGNGTPINTEVDDEFYFVRNKKSEIEFGLIQNFNDLSNFGASIEFSRVKVENIDNRFIALESDVNPDIYDSQFFAGLRLGYGFENYDSSLKPHNGIKFDVSLIGRKHLNSASNDNLVFDTRIQMYKSIGQNQRFIYGTRIGFRHVIGGSYFYQRGHIGGDQGLRGFRRDRFYGTTTFFHNNNLNFHIAQRREGSTAKHSYGLSLYFDHGRVWSDSDITQTWHINYGGGLFFSPLDVFVISGGIFISEEEPQYRIGVGWLL